MERPLRLVIAGGVVSVTLTAAALLGWSALSWLTIAPLSLGSLVWPTTAGFAALLFVLQQQGFVFHWREETTKVSLDEIGIFLALLVLSPALVVLAIGVGALGNQLAHHRDMSKSAFNVAQYATAALVATAVVALLHQAGLAAPWSAIAAPPVFALLTSVQVSSVFAHKEGLSTLQVFTQRFARFALVGSALGVSLGLVVYALFRIHPVAVVAAVPVFAYLRRFGRLSEWADDELKTHKLVAALGAEVAGRADMDRVAKSVLAACDEIFDCGEATLNLAQGGEAPSFWRTGKSRGDGHGGVAAEIRTFTGEIVGTLSIFPKPAQKAYGEREQHLLRTVAASTAAAAANAEALRVTGETNRELAASKKQQAETIKRLENMNRELEEFTLWTTHDMREPLRSIGTIAGFLHEDIGTIDADEARDLARRISDGAERLKERVKALHAFSLIVQRDDEFRDVDMQGVVENVVAALEARIAERKATVLLPRVKLPTVRAQPHRIDQVLANLIENALKYGREEGAMVEVGFAETSTEWRFFVRDDGPGIPTGYHERIFQLFQRGPLQQEAGSGAGLAIVKRIAEQHGGRVWVESEEGNGACFIVTLPKRPAGEALLSERVIAPRSC